MILRFLIVAFLLIAHASSTHAQTPKTVETVEGLWLTQNKRAVVKLMECEELGLCGSIYWIIEGGMLRDKKNPDESLRGRAICGLNILWGFEQDSETQWDDGHIYKADDGDTYSANLELLDDGTLKVRGYVGFSFLGKTQIWTRENADDYTACAID